MKNLYIILSLMMIFIITNSFAHTTKTFTPKKFSLELTAGPSFPYGDFGRDDVLRQSSGYAKLGYKAEVNASYHLFDLIDITAMGFYNTNGTDLNALTNDINKQNPGTHFTSESRKWDMFGGYAGLQFAFLVSGKITGVFKAYSGFINIKAPEFILRSGNDYYKQSELTTNAFSYIVSLGANYPLSRSLYFTIKGDFIGANPNFENVNIITYINGITNLSTTSFTQTIKVFSLNAGIKYVF